MKYLIMGLMLFTSISTLAHSRTEIKRACKTLKVDIENQRKVIEKQLATCKGKAPIMGFDECDLAKESKEHFDTQNHYQLRVFSTSLNNDVDVSLNYDCKEKLLLVETLSWSDLSKSVYEFRKEHINFSYNPVEKSVHFNMINSRYDITLAVGDPEFEEDTREYNEKGEIVRGELKTINYEDKILFFPDHFNGTSKVVKTTKNNRDVLSSDEYYFGIGNLIYPEGLFLTNVNVLLHREVYFKQLDYNQILKELNLQ